jgi:hypothetical protein
MKHVALVTFLLVCGCAAESGAELACQKRMVAVQEIPKGAEDEFGALAYAQLDRAGCTEAQLATLDQLIEVTNDMTEMSRSEQSNDYRRHSSLTQGFFNAESRLEELQQGIGARLVQLEQAQ